MIDIREELKSYERSIGDKEYDVVSLKARNIQECIIKRIFEVKGVKNTSFEDNKSRISFAGNNLWITPGIEKDMNSIRDITNPNMHEGRNINSNSINMNVDELSEQLKRITDYYYANYDKAYVEIRNAYDEFIKIGRENEAQERNTDKIKNRKISKIQLILSVIWLVISIFLFFTFRYDVIGAVMGESFVDLYKTGSVVITFVHMCMFFAFFFGLPELLIIILVEKTIKKRK